MKKLVLLSLVILSMSIATGIAGAVEQKTVDQLVLDANYALALQAVEQILTKDPGNDEAYALKARIRILALKEANRTLNEMILEDLEKVDDRLAYTDLLKSLYAQAGMELIIPFRPDYSAAYQINAEGSISENMGSYLWPDSKPGDGYAVSGVFAAQGDWIYFLDPQNGFGLWKIRAGGGSRQRVLQEIAGSLNVNGDWIYYRAVEENNKIYKVRTDGSEKTLLSSDSCSNLCVKDEWIYYTNAGEGNTLYTMRIDGSERRSLGKQGKLHFIRDFYLYYSSIDDKNLMRLHIWEGKEETLLKKQWHIAPRLIDGRLYYVVDQKGIVVMVMEPDGSNKTEVLRVDGKVYCYAIIENHLVLSVRTRKDQEVLLSYDLSTMKEPTLLSDTSTEALCLDTAGHLYALKADGLYLLDLLNYSEKRME